MVRFKFTYTFFVTFGRHSCCLNPLHVVAQSRAQLLEPRRAGGLASRNSEVLSLSPSLLLVLAARKCSAPNHVTLMLAFTSLSLPLQDDESSSEEEEEAESPAESSVSCRAPCLLLLETCLGRTLVSFADGLPCPHGRPLGWKLVGANSCKPCAQFLGTCAPKKAPLWAS